MEYIEIQKLIDSMGESKLTDLDIEFADGMKISMKKNIMPFESSEITALQERRETIISNLNVESKKENPNVHIVKSPMVGTFYSKPNPEADPFVKDGDGIQKGQTLCIIEAMKLMNEIESEYNGIVKKVLVKDGEMVEYGQPIFEIE